MSCILDHDASDIIEKLEIDPARGSLLPLKTKAEVQSRDETIEVYVCQVPRKLGAKVLSLIKTIPQQQSINLAHLRRVASHTHIPSQLQSLLSTATRDEESDEPPLFVLLAPTSIISLPALTSFLAASVPSLATPSILTLRVPLHAPSSQAEAASHSALLWPTHYNPNSSHAPSPHVRAQARAQLEPSAGKWVSLARKVAEEAYANGLGEQVGAVVVAGEKVVCVAGDGRWYSCAKSRADTAASTMHHVKGNGNVAAHAVLRAINLVAKRRRELAVEASGTTSTASEDTSNETTLSDNILHRPHTQLEKLVYADSTETNALSVGGYLCVNLTVYVTHEPCVMCCMALVHSRVAGVVFARSSGSGAAKGCGSSVGGFGVGDGDGGAGVGYGLHWRRELNWQFLCWEWVDEAEEWKDQTRDAPGELEL